MRRRDVGETEFKLNYEGTKNLAVGDIVRSDQISAGGHIWTVRCYPHGDSEENNGAYLSVFLELHGDSKDIKVIFEASLLGRDGAPSRSDRSEHVYPRTGRRTWGFPGFVKRSVLESDYVVDGQVKFKFQVRVLCQDPIPVPPSNIGAHLGSLLDHTDSSDVSFSVGGEIFPAHRAVLAARSPVFKALLFGPMADAKMPRITLRDIHPSTFRMLLRFLYTDALPGGDEDDDDDETELFLDLLAAADMYHLDRLKLWCAQKIWSACVSAETVATILAYAETHSCQELKSRCLDFFVVDENFKIAVLTDGYFELMRSCPSVIDEIRARRTQT